MSERIEERAAQYILRKEDGDWSSQDQLELDAWLEESPRNRAVFWRLEHGWAMSDRIVALNLPAKPYVAVGVVRASLTRFGIAAAASIIPILAGWMILFHDAPAPPLTEYTTQVGGRKVISLADGSTIDLNTDSSIRLDFSSKSRMVYLDRGEAFFDVAHDRKRPFIVRSGDREILDIGTKFVVRKAGEQFVAAVVEGRVKFGRIEKGKVGGDQILDAGDRVISEGHTSLVVYDDEKYIDKMIGWRSGMLIFDRATLSQAAAEFNRYNRRKLIVSREGLEDVQIGGSFSASNLDGFARLLGEAYGLSVRNTPEQIIISRD